MAAMLLRLRRKPGQTNDATDCSEGALGERLRLLSIDALEGAGSAVAVALAAAAERPVLPHASPRTGGKSGWLVETSASQPEASSPGLQLRLDGSHSSGTSRQQSGASCFQPSGTAAPGGCQVSEPSTLQHSATGLELSPLPSTTAPEANRAAAHWVDAALFKGRGPPPHQRGVGTAGVAGSWWLHSDSLRLQWQDVALCADEEGQPVLLGRGTFSQVYAGRLYGTLPVAIKALRTGHCLSSDQRYTNFWREAAVLARCRHPNVVQLLGVYSGTSSGMPPLNAATGTAGVATLQVVQDDGGGRLLLVVTELLLGGTVKQRLGEPEMRWSCRGARVALDVAQALAFLHDSLGIVHLDVKAANVLLSAQGVTKLADVGVSRMADESASQCGGTHLYASPEQLLGLHCGPPADIFAFGWLLQEIITGRALKRRGGRAVLRVPNDCPAGVARLVDACLHPEPGARPTAEQIVQKVKQDISERQGS